MCVDVDLWTASIYLEAMEGDLSWLARTDLSEDQRIDLLPLLIEQIAAALCALHTIGVIHNDMKASNILVAGVRTNKDGEIVLSPEVGFKLTDLGISSSRLGLPRYNIGGTLWSRAPESLAGRNTNDYNYFESDIWGLGLCCVMLLTSRHIIRGDNEDGVLSSIYNNTIAAVYDGHDDFTAFKAAVVDGSISDSLDIDKLLHDYIDYSHIDPELLETLIAMLQLNPKDRISDEQLSKCSHSSSKQIINHNVKLAFPAYYQHHSAELWWLVRSYGDGVSFITMAYELSLRLLTLTDDVDYVRLSMPVICCLTDCYLLGQLTPVDVYRYLSSHTSSRITSQEFMLATVRILELLDGHIYNFHCSDAIESITTSITELTINVMADYYRPTATVTDQWYADINNVAVDDSRQDQQQQLLLLARKQELDDRQMGYQVSKKNDYYAAANLLFHTRHYFKLTDKIIFQCLQFINTALDDQTDMERQQYRLVIFLCLQLACWLNTSRYDIIGYLKLDQEFSTEHINNTLQHLCSIVDIAAVTAYNYIEVLIDNQQGSQRANQLTDQQSKAIKEFCRYICLATIASAEIFVPTQQIEPSLLVTTAGLLAEKLLAVNFTLPSYFGGYRETEVDRCLNLIATAIRKHKTRDDYFYKFYSNLSFLPRLLSALQIQ